MFSRFTRLSSFIVLAYICQIHLGVAQAETSCHFIFQRYCSDLVHLTPGSQQRSSLDNEKAEVLNWIEGMYKKCFYQPKGQWLKKARRKWKQDKTKEQVRHLRKQIEFIGGCKRPVYASSPQKSAKKDAAEKESVEKESSYSDPEVKTQSISSQFMKHIEGRRFGYGLLAGTLGGVGASLFVHVVEGDRFGSRCLLCSEGKLLLALAVGVPANIIGTALGVYLTSDKMHNGSFFHALGGALIGTLAGGALGLVPIFIPVIGPVITLIFVAVGSSLGATYFYNRFKTLKPKYKVSKAKRVLSSLRVNPWLGQDGSGLSLSGRF